MLLKEIMEPHLFPFSLLCFLAMRQTVLIWHVHLPWCVVSISGYNGASVSCTDTSKMQAKINPCSLQVDLMYTYLYYLYTNISILHSFASMHLFIFKNCVHFLMVICFVVLRMEARALHTAKKYFTTELNSHSPPPKCCFCQVWYIPLLSDLWRQRKLISVNSRPAQST